MINLSKGGLAIVTDSPLAPGDRYSASLATESDRSQVEGWVAWRRPVPLGAGEERAPDQPPLYQVGLSVERVEKEPREAPAAPAPARQPIAVKSTGGGVRSAPRRRAADLRLRAENLDAQVVNLSSRGLAIETDHPLSRGQAYDARLEGGDRSVSLKAIVVWCVATSAEPGEEGASSPRYAAGLSIRGAARRSDRVPPPAPHAGLVDEPPASPPSAEDVAPWLAEVMADLEGEGRTAAGRSWRRPALGAAALAALGLVVAYSLSGPSAEEPAPAAATPAVGSAPASSTAESMGRTTGEASAAAPPVVTSPLPAPAPEQAAGTLRPRAGINVRRGPGLEFPVARTTEEGERLPYRSKEGEWFRLAGEEELWVHESTIQGIEPSGEPR